MQRYALNIWLVAVLEIKNRILVYRLRRLQVTAALAWADADIALMEKKLCRKNPTTSQ